MVTAGQSGKKMASVWDIIRAMPSFESLNPRNSTSSTPNMHFSEFSETERPAPGDHHAVQWRAMHHYVIQVDGDTLDISQ